MYLCREYLLFMDRNNFDEIRSYRNEEVGAALQRIAQSEQFRKVIAYIMPEVDIDEFAAKLSRINNTEDFQYTIALPYLQKLEKQLTKGIQSDHLEVVADYDAALFITNHRDIVLDSSFLCKIFLEHKMKSVEIGIGDNLLIYPWIEDFVRLNKSFIVKRGGGTRELFHNSMRLSAYIRQDITEKHQSVWIAQREGRCKDSNDRTQESLLKMLAMSGKGMPNEVLKPLNICPVSISYEYDPCDYLKAKEFQQKRDNPNYQKSPADDLLSMQVGITGYKGRVMFRFAPSINPFLDELGQREKDKAAQFSAIASEIDRRIHQNYELYSGNLVAYDLLLGVQRFANNYSAEEKAVFEQYIAGQMAKIDLPKKDEAFLYKKLLEMYANPVINHLESIKS